MAPVNYIIKALYEISDLFKNFDGNCLVGFDFQSCEFGWRVGTNFRNQQSPDGKISDISLRLQRFAIAVDSSRICQHGQSCLRVHFRQRLAL